LRCVSHAAHNSLRPFVADFRQQSGTTWHSSGKPPARSDLFTARWLELPPRPIDQKVFQHKPPLPAIQRRAAVMAFYPAMRRLRLRFDANQQVLRIAISTAKMLRM